MLSIPDWKAITSRLVICLFYFIHHSPFIPGAGIFTEADKSTGIMASMAMR
jgi:hypothetical protein